MRKVGFSSIVYLGLTKKKFDNELEYLLWFFKRKQRMKSSKTPNAKQLKYIIDKLEDLQKDDKQDLKNELSVNFNAMMKSCYMLDYTIWRYVRFSDEIEIKNEKAK